MSGTKWVGGGEGATIGDICDKLRGNISDTFILGFVTRIGETQKPMIFDILKYKTNLALTGESLTAEDLDNFAKCE